MLYDLIVPHDLAKWIVKENGFESWFNFLKSKFPQKDIYSVSNAWYIDKKYICKAKGKYGDLIIGWED